MHGFVAQTQLYPATNERQLLRYSLTLHHDDSKQFYISHGYGLGVEAFGMASRE